VCRETIERICNTPEDPNIGEKEAQLREIAKAITKLEKIQVPIPDALRAEKTKLAASLGGHNDVEQPLRLLADEFGKIVINIRSRLTSGNRTSSSKKKRTYGARSTLPKKPHGFYRDYIINALKKLGGKARVIDVLAEMERQLNGNLLPGDLELRKDGKTVGWRNTAQWERFIMVKEGILRSDSPNGIWELSEGHR